MSGNRNPELRADTRRGSAIVLRPVFDDQTSPDRPSSPTVGAVSFDVSAPLGSPLHITSFWSARADAPSEALPQETIDLSSKFSIPAADPTTADPTTADPTTADPTTADPTTKGATEGTGTTEQCMPDLLKKPFLWRDVYRRAGVFSGKTKVGAYIRPATRDDWEGLQKDLSEKEEEAKYHRFLLIMAFPAGLILSFLLMVMAFNIVPLVSRTLAAVVFITGIAIAFSSHLADPNPSGRRVSPGYDGKYRAAEEQDLLHVPFLCRGSRAATHMWEALQIQVQATNVPILRGDLERLYALVSCPWGFIPDSYRRGLASDRSAALTVGRCSIDPRS